MALSVATLAGFPAANSAFNAPSGGTPAVAATFAFTNNVYTQVGTQYVAGYLDREGVVPSRVFYANNNTGSGAPGATLPLPTLVSCTRLVYVDHLGNTQVEGFTVILTPAEPGPDSGGTGSYSGGLTSTANLAVTLDNVPPYTTATPVTQYPQPQIRLLLSPAAILILASTQYG